MKVVSAELDNKFRTLIKFLLGSRFKRVCKLKKKQL